MKRLGIKGVLTLGLFLFGALVLFNDVVRIADMPSLSIGAEVEVTELGFVTPIKNIGVCDYPRIEEDQAALLDVRNVFRGHRGLRLASAEVTGTGCDVLPYKMSIFSNGSIGQFSKLTKHPFNEGNILFSTGRRPVGTQLKEDTFFNGGCSANIFKGYIYSALLFGSQRIDELRYIDDHIWSLFYLERLPRGFQGLFGDMSRTSSDISSYLSLIGTAAHFFPLESSNNAITNDSKQRENFHPKFPPLKSVALMLFGFVGVYYAWWNLYFGAQDWRGFLITLIGCAVFGYGLSGMLLWSVAF